jgi:kinesin family protein 5
VGFFIFRVKSSQSCLLVFNINVVPQSVLEGYNGTIMAYGQTRIVKSFTLGRLGEKE